MMKGVMMSAVLAVSPPPTTGQSEPAPAMSEAGQQVVTSLVTAGKQAFTSPYTVTVKKIEPIAGSNQVRVTLFVTGDDEPAHDFTETGQQVVTAFLNAGMHANVSGAGTATVQKIEAIEGGDDDSGDDDSDENSDADALSGLVANADAPVAPATPSASPSAPVPAPESAPPQPPTAGREVAGAPFDDDRPDQHVRPPRAP
jgi:hypothetical protein